MRRPWHRLVGALSLMLLGFGASTATAKVGSVSPDMYEIVGGQVNLRAMFKELVPEYTPEVQGPSTSLGVSGG